ncbi:MAG: hypothetical protein AAF196_09490 [Planctomycetota bacterium]
MSERQTSPRVPGLWPWVLFLALVNVAVPLAFGGELWSETGWVTSAAGTPDPADGSWRSWSESWGMVSWIGEPGQILNTRTLNLWPLFLLLGDLVATALVWARWGRWSGLASFASAWCALAAALVSSGFLFRQTAWA